MEIKKDIEPLEEGKTHTAEAGDFLITESHTIGDIVRFAVSQSDINDIQFILNNLREEEVDALHGDG